MSESAGDGCFAALGILLVGAFVVAALKSLSDADTRHHMELCAVQLKAAPTSRDTLLVIRADAYCLKLVGSSAQDG